MGKTQIRSFDVDVKKTFISNENTTKLQRCDDNQITASFCFIKLDGQV